MSLTLGVAAALGAQQRSAHKPAHLVASTSPTNPLPGKPFTITFSLVKAGVNQPINGPDCLGMTSGKPIPLASKTSDGYTATCTWNVPTKTGPTFDGMAVAFDSNHVEYFYGYDFPIG